MNTDGDDFDRGDFGEPGLGTTDAIGVTTGAKYIEVDLLYRTQVLLLLLSKLEPNQKVLFTTPMILKQNSLYDYFLRKYYREDSSTNLESLRQLNKTLARLFESPLTPRQRESLVADISKAIEGIKNLYTTYNHDTVFAARLELVLREMTEVMRVGGK